MARHPKTKAERQLAYKKKHRKILNSGMGYGLQNRFVIFDYEWGTDVLRFHILGREPRSYISEMSGSRRKQYLKTQVHRAVRRYKGSIPKGNWRNKIKDYWWNLL